MSNQNNLQLINLDTFPELKLTELENTMIALNIIFQKVFQLPKLRWPAMKDRTVNIPIFEADVLNTVKSLPRTPNEAGIIPVNLKRKVSYKNIHLVQYVSVTKIMKALSTLKELGNEYYQFVPHTDNFENKCREQDIDSFKLLFPDSNAIGENTEDSEPVLTEDEEEAQDDEEEYCKKDSVKKWQ